MFRERSAYFTFQTVRQQESSISILTGEQMKKEEGAEERNGPFFGELKGNVVANVSKAVMGRDASKEITVTFEK